MNKMDYFYNPYNTGIVFDRFMTFKEEPESILKAYNQKYTDGKFFMQIKNKKAQR